MRGRHREFDRFWEEAAAGRLCFPRCRGCGRFHWYPMKRCPHCQGRDLAWEAVAGPGRLYSWSTVHHPFDPDYRDKVPYVVALVEFDDAPGVRLVTNIEGAADDAFAIGMPVVPDFDRFRVDPARLVFRPGPA